MELWAYAQVRLGLSREQFFRLQARQLNALIRQDRNRREEQEFLFAQLAAAVINFSMCHPEKPVQIDALMPSRMREKSRPRYQSRERVARNLGQMFAGFMR